MKITLGFMLVLVVSWFAAFSWAGYQSAQNLKLKNEAAQQAGCTAYLVTGTLAESAGSGSCDHALVALVNTARASHRCDQALLLDGVSLDCSFAVQGLFAQKGDLQTQLQTTVADQAAAIARAEARATATAQRKTKDANALASAPRQPDGLIVCDTDCLRQRFEP